MPTCNKKVYNRLKLRKYRYMKLMENTILTIEVRNTMQTHLSKQG